MRGSILAYADNKGVVSGHDGNRYEFTRLEWSGNREPTVGMEIDFSTDGSQAKSVFPIANAASSKHSKLTLALVAIFVGALGIHRFMVGKVGSGIAMAVLTVTMIGSPISIIWSIVDFIVILCGNFTDKDGNKITE